MKHSIIAVFVFLLVSCTSKAPVDYSAQWTQLQTSITYGADNVTEVSRTDNAYDASGRLVMVSKYSNGIQESNLVSKSHEYVYSAHLLTYTQDLYTNGQVSFTTKYKIKYMDPYWSRPDTIIAYTSDGVTETGRTEYTYDNQYRKTGIVNKLKGVVTSKSYNYTYSGKSYEYFTDNYLNGTVSSTIKHSESYYDGNGLKPQTSIVYAPDNTTEDSKTENTYDGEGKIIFSYNYVKGVLVSKSHDYTYNGKEVTFLTDNYTNGVFTSALKSKYVYFK
jgi:antitoxin component YwqK of YwqJK toxin-antitoxin module